MGWLAWHIVLVVYGGSRLLGFVRCAVWLRSLTVAARQGRQSVSTRRVRVLGLAIFGFQLQRPYGTPQGMKWGVNWGCGRAKNEDLSGELVPRFVNLVRLADMDPGVGLKAREAKYQPLRRLLASQ